MRAAPKAKQSSRSRTLSAFRGALRQWARQNGRSLPWRETRDPYAILVSELMLQQTQVSTVLPYYQAWLARFPELRALARAGESDVLHAWQGLGYYSRARHLHHCAQIIERNFDGRVPSSVEALRSLPGLGRYTANAIAVFAFDQSLPLVEANTARVLARLFNIRERIDTAPGRKKLWEQSAAVVPKREARAFQNAMMDLGALVCTAREPRCSICPVKKFCRAPDPGRLPAKRGRAAALSLTETHRFHATANAILLEKCRTRWRGMWMLPPGARNEGSPIHRSHFPFTNHRITLEIFRGRSTRITSAQRWFGINEISAIPIPSPHRRAIETLLAAR